MDTRITHDDADGYPVPPELMEPTDPAERKRLLDEAEASIRAGRGVPHEKVGAWLYELAAGRAAKAPCDL